MLIVLLFHLAYPQFKKDHGNKKPISGNQRALASRKNIEFPGTCATNEDARAYLSQEVEEDGITDKQRSLLQKRYKVGVGMLLWSHLGCICSTPCTCPHLVPIRGSDLASNCA